MKYMAAFFRKQWNTSVQRFCVVLRLSQILFNGVELQYLTQPMDRCGTVLEEEGISCTWVSSF